MTRSHARAGRYSGRRPMTTEFQDLSPADLRSARARVAKGARLTPLLPSDALSERLGHPVALKCENLQAGGAFKIRGASNFLARPIEAGEARRRDTHSSRHKLHPPPPPGRAGRGARALGECPET